MRVFSELEQAAHALANQRKEISGLLKVTAPSGFGRHRLVPLIARLHAQHPQLRIQLRLSDEIMDLIAGGFDLGIRYGVIPDDAHMVARELVQNRRFLCASPAYLRLHGTPRRLTDLAHHHVQ